MEEDNLPSLVENLTVLATVATTKCDVCDYILRAILASIASVEEESEEQRIGRRRREESTIERPRSPHLDSVETKRIWRTVRTCQVWISVRNEGQRGN